MGMKGSQNPGRLVAIICHHQLLPSGSLGPRFSRGHQTRVRSPSGSAASWPVSLRWTRRQPLLSAVVPRAFKGALYADWFFYLTHQEGCVCWVLDARWLSLCSLPPATHTSSKWKRWHPQASSDFMVNARLPPRYNEFRDSWPPYLGKAKDCDPITFSFSWLRRKMSTKGSDRKKKFWFLSHEVRTHGPNKQPKVWASVSASSL